MSPAGLYSRVLVFLDPVIDDCWLSSTKGVNNVLGDGGAVNDMGSSDTERWRCRLRRHNIPTMIKMSVGMSMHERTMATVFLVLIFVGELVRLSPAMVLLEGEAGGDESDAEPETGWEMLAPVIEDDVGIKLLELVLAPEIPVERLSEVLGTVEPVSELVWVEGAAPVLLGVSVLVEIVLLEVSVSVGIVVPVPLEALGSVTLKSEFEVAIGVLPLQSRTISTQIKAQQATQVALTQKQQQLPGII
jgi:hypothetical protein